jgi:hypothetical protein
MAVMSYCGEAVNKVTVSRVVAVFHNRPAIHRKVIQEEISSKKFQHNIDFISNRSKLSE